MCDRRPVFQVRTLSTFMRRTHFEKFGNSKIETQMYTLVWPRKAFQIIRAYLTKAFYQLSQTVGGSPSSRRGEEGVCIPMQH